MYVYYRELTVTTEWASLAVQYRLGLSAVEQTELVARTKSCSNRHCESMVTTQRQARESKLM